MTPAAFEAAIRERTRPLNGQYPRPWMTALHDPRQARVFIVGKNQRHGYEAAIVGAHERHLDALFNRNGITCRELYDRVTGGKPSPTRQHTDELTARLAARSVTDVLETNVICYSTPMSVDLSKPAHRGGEHTGSELFQFLLTTIRPPIIIAHGAGTRTTLAKALRHPLPAIPDGPGRVVSARIPGSYAPTVIVIPSLAPPGYNGWCRWASAHLAHVADAVAAMVRALDESRARAADHASMADD